MGNTATIGAAPQHLQALEEAQHLRALEEANRVRLARADIKRKIAAQERCVADVILSCPSYVRRMDLIDLLMSQKRWGRERCRRLLLSQGVPENKQIGTLTERQRRALAAVLSAERASAATRDAASRPAATRESEERELSAA
jgi:hypothetical protein